MDGFKHFLSEMPIALNKVGKWGEKDRPYGYGRPDIGIMNNVRGLEKIGRGWAKVQQQFNVYLCRSSECFKVNQVGEVDEDYLRSVLKLNVVPSPTGNPNDVVIDKNAITVIFANNKGVERIHLGAWGLAHRCGHGIMGLQKSNVSFDYYARELWLEIRRIINGAYGLNVRLSDKFAADSNSENILKSFCYSVGTMKSCRDKNLVRAFEFTYELLAQWITQGKVSFNPLPRNFKYWKQGEVDYTGKQERGSWFYASVSDDFESWAEQLEYLKDQVESNLDHALESAVGRIYVM
jgi:hypothetical protein